MNERVGMMTRLGLCALLAGTLTACDLSDHLDDSMKRSEETVINIPEAVTVESPAAVLPLPVQQKLDLIKQTLDENSIRALVRLAEQEPDFQSNFGGLSHYDHWYIQKRAGLDPIEKTREILEQPYGVKDFGAYKYYIWPELATRPTEDLDFSRLTFQERATLTELIGEAGLERIRNGEAYPGFRLAIREDGSWAYLLQDN